MLVVRTQVFLDRVMVTYYGVPTPLNQMASITIPEARILMITPFDKTMIQEVEKAIMQKRHRYHTC